MVKKEANMKEEYRRKIKNNYGKLSSLFKTKRFDEIGKILGNSTILISPEGKRYMGRKRLGEFWKSERKKAGSVEFNLKYLYVRKVKNPVERGAATIDYVGHTVTEFHLISAKKNCTGSFSDSRLHSRVCLWRS